MKRLKISQFGNSVLREPAKSVDFTQISTAEIQELISEMRRLLLSKKLGIGLAAPQVGKSLAVAVIELQKTALRDDEQVLSLVIINPTVTKTFGPKSQLWEGCISSGKGGAGLFAKVPRYKKIELAYTDENAVKHTKEFSGLAAHVIQHEVDHINGVLFVDRVKDTKTYMSYGEYKKMKLREKAKRV